MPRRRRNCTFLRPSPLSTSGKLRVTGDTEAVVALRNALDDVDGGVVESITRAFGPLAPVAVMTVAHLRGLSRQGERS